MNLEATHLLLIRAADDETCRERALAFFARNLLVKYDAVQVDGARSFRADHQDFWETIEGGIRSNHQALGDLLRELADAGFAKLTDLARMEQGYQSKTLHTITHLLDGFFGIDTCFYNLEEDSHWLSERLAATIRQQPRDFRVVTMACSSRAATSGDLLARIRKFEV